MCRVLFFFFLMIHGPVFKPCWDLLVEQYVYLNLTTRTFSRCHEVFVY